MHVGVFSRLEKHGRATFKAQAERKKERAFLKQMKNLNSKLEAMMSNSNASTNINIKKI